MGHAIHFLERLERLSMPQADSALALYRDPELVRFVLRRAKLPDGVDRVALAVEKNQTHRTSSWRATAGSSPAWARA
jgi:hypothetical protein